jgi:hypothetical protein
MMVVSRNSRCLKELWELSCMMEAPKIPQVKKHSRAAQIQDWNIINLLFMYFTNNNVIFTNYCYWSKLGYVKIVPTYIDAQSFSNSFDGVLGVVRKSRGDPIFLFYYIFTVWPNFLKSFEYMKCPLPPPPLCAAMSIGILFLICCPFLHQWTPYANRGEKNVYLSIVYEFKPLRVHEPILESCHGKQANDFRRENKKTKNWKNAKNINNFPVRSQTWKIINV